MPPKQARRGILVQAQIDREKRAEWKRKAAARDSSAGSAQYQHVFAYGEIAEMVCMCLVKKRRLFDWKNFQAFVQTNKQIRNAVWNADKVWMLLFQLHFHGLYNCLAERWHGCLSSTSILKQSFGIEGDETSKEVRSQFVVRDRRRLPYFKRMLCRYFYIRTAQRCAICNSLSTRAFGSIVMNMRVCETHLPGLFITDEELFRVYGITPWTKVMCKGARKPDAFVNAIRGKVYLNVVEMDRGERQKYSNYSYDWAIRNQMHQFALFARKDIYATLDLEHSLAYKKAAQTVLAYMARRSDKYPEMWAKARAKKTKTVVQRFVARVDKDLTLQARKENDKAVRGHRLYIEDRERSHYRINAYTMLFSMESGYRHLHKIRLFRHDMFVPRDLFFADVQDDSAVAV